MFFRINKIDTDIRRKLQEKTKDGKVHKTKKVKIANDFNDCESKNNIEDNEKHEQKYITVDGEINNTEELEISAEKEINKLNSRGIILDQKR